MSLLELTNCSKLHKNLKLALLHITILIANDSIEAGER